MIKPQTEIRNLKKDLSKLREVCKIAGVPLFIIYLPDLVLNSKRKPLTPKQIKWAKQKIKEYEATFEND